MSLRTLLLYFIIFSNSAYSQYTSEIENLISRSAIYYGLKFDPITSDMSDELCIFSIYNPQEIIDNINITTNDINSREFIISFHESGDQSGALFSGHNNPVYDYYENTYRALLEGVERDIEIGLYSEVYQLTNDLKEEFVDNIHRATIQTGQFNIELLIKVDPSIPGRNKVSTLEIRVYSLDYNYRYMACRAIF